METTLRKAVVERGADLGVAYDGDADRLGVVNERGGVVWGDRLMCLFWREILSCYPGAPAIVEVKCSQALVEEINRLGGRPFFYRTGHSLIKAKLIAVKPCPVEKSPPVDVVPQQYRLATWTSTLSSVPAVDPFERGKLRHIFVFYLPFRVIWSGFIIPRALTRMFWAGVNPALFIFRSVRQPLDDGPGVIQRAGQVNLIHDLIQTF